MLQVEGQASGAAAAEVHRLGGMLQHALAAVQQPRCLTHNSNLNTPSHVVPTQLAGTVEVHEATKSNLARVVCAVLQAPKATRLSSQGRSCSACCCHVQ
jgi:hypothetical protein